MTSPCHTTTHKIIAPPQIYNLSQPPSIHHNQFVSSPVPTSSATALTVLSTPSTSHTPSLAVTPSTQSRFRNRRSSRVCSLFHFFSNSHTALDSINLSALPQLIYVSWWFPKTQELFYWFGIWDLIRRTTNKRKRICVSYLIFYLYFLLDLWSFHHWIHIFISSSSLSLPTSTVKEKRRRRKKGERIGWHDSDNWRHDWRWWWWFPLEKKKKRKKKKKRREKKVMTWHWYDLMG